MTENLSPFIKFNYQGNVENDEGIQTNTIENFTFSMQELEFKLHLSFVLEI